MNSTAAIPIPTAGFEDLLSFEPSAARVRFLDQRMRLRLAESLRYILHQGNGLLQVPSGQFQKFLQQLESGPVSPLAFSFYSDTVLAIEEDNIEEASRLLREMISLPAHPGDVLISELGDPQHYITPDCIADFSFSIRTIPLSLRFFRRPARRRATVAV